jgi:hypothetical protein
VCLVLEDDVQMHQVVDSANESLVNPRRRNKCVHKKQCHVTLVLGDDVQMY